MDYYWHPLFRITRPRTIFTFLPQNDTTICTVARINAYVQKTEYGAIQERSGSDSTVSGSSFTDEIGFSGNLLSLLQTYDGLLSHFIENIPQPPRGNHASSGQ